MECKFGMECKFCLGRPGHALLLALFTLSMAQLLYFINSYDDKIFHKEFILYPTVAPDSCLSYALDRPKNEVLTDLASLVLVTASLKRADIRKMLTQALNTSQADVRLLLCRLVEFTRTYRCSNCTAEQSLPRTVLRHDLRLAHSASWQGHALPVIVTMASGRLGNVMGEYASLYALHKIYNVTAFITSKHKSVMNMFPNLSLQQIEVGSVASWKQLGADAPERFAYASLQLAAAGLLGPHKFLSREFPFERQLFNAFRGDILKEFTFSDKVLNKTARQLAGVENRTVRSSPDEPITFVGVHIRLTDYPNHMKVACNNHLLSLTKFGVNVTYDKYLTRAVHHYKRLHNNTVFVVTSDNRTYTQSFFKKIGENNTFIFSGSPAEDMSLLTHCNQSIVTFGTYGFWTGYLSPGTTVYPDMPTSKRPYPHSRFFYEQALLDQFIPLPVL